MDARRPGGNKQEMAGRRRVSRSFFTRKLERRLAEKKSDVPQRLLNLMDVPFEDFTPEEGELYEVELKPLTPVFVEHLMQTYAVMGSPRQGWEEMLERVPSCPIKVLASLVIREDDASRQRAQREPDAAAAAPAMPPRSEKINVRAYARGREAQGKGRWWERKVF